MGQIAAALAASDNGAKDAPIQTKADKPGNGGAQSAGSRGTAVADRGPRIAESAGTAGGGVVVPKGLVLLVATAGSLADVPVPVGRAFTHTLAVGAPTPAEQRAVLRHALLGKPRPADRAGERVVQGAWGDKKARAEGGVGMEKGAAPDAGAGAGVGRGVEGQGAAERETALKSVLQPESSAVQESTGQGTTLQGPGQVTEVCLMRAVLSCASATQSHAAPRGLYYGCACHSC